MMRVMIGLLVMGAGLAMGQDQTRPTLEEAKAEFQKQDEALNKVYASLKKELADYQFPFVQEDQREWMDYRNYVSEGQVRRNPEKFKESVDYWETAAGMTESRVEYLRAWLGVGDGGDWTGKYTDGRGGHLEIVESKKGIYFAIEVVRGPNFNSGVMGGLAKVNESMARFSIPIEGSDEECWITLMNDHDGDGRIELVTVNSHEFHGARAYFDAKYLRVGLLTKAQEAVIVKRAKAGGMHE